MVTIPETMVIKVVCFDKILLDLYLLHIRAKGNTLSILIIIVGIDQMANPEIMSANAPPKAPAIRQYGNGKIQAVR